jgi:regulator of protease activity HflC (stomatin/prohibitin superfamily)
MSTFVVLLIMAGIGLIAVLGLRLVPSGHIGLVIRAGRVVRTRAPGLVPVLPGVERLEVVSRHAQEIDPLVTTALTLDGVEVRLVASALWEVTDPEAAAAATPDARAAVADAIDRALHHVVGRVDLAELLRDREAVLSWLPEATRPLMRRAGAELLDLDLLEVEVRVGPSLLRLLA